MKKYNGIYYSFISFTTLVISLLFTTQTVFAQGIKDKTMLDAIANKSGVNTVGTAENLAGTVIKAVLGISGLIFLILMVYAGIIWMLARGDEGEVERSKNIIQAALIGLAVTVSAYAITVFINSVLTSAK
jgi:hypothetical protein